MHGETINSVIRVVT